MLDNLVNVEDIKNISFKNPIRVGKYKFLKYGTIFHERKIEILKENNIEYVIYEGCILF